MGELAANMLVPLTGGHSVFYLNYSIIYIKVTGIFPRFIIRDNNSVPPLSHSCTILFLFTLVLRIPRTYNSPFSSARSLPSTLVSSSSSHRFIHFFQPRFFPPSSFSIYIYIYNIYTFPPIKAEPVINLKRHKLYRQEE